MIHVGLRLAWSPGEKTEINVIKQQDCSMLDWTSAANGALLVMPEAP
jgi:hypothetical protein